MAKILVIEDTKLLRDDILLILNYEGYEAIGAEDGAVGVQLAYESQPDLIICDVLMPGMDGYGVLTALRKFPELVQVPFVFLTAKAETEAIEHGLALGASSYLLKPFTTKELLATIRAKIKI